MHSVPIDTSNVLSTDGQIDKGAFLSYWKAVDDSKEVYAAIADLPALDIKVNTQQSSHNQSCSDPSQ